MNCQCTHDALIRHWLLEGIVQNVWNAHFINQMVRERAGVYMKQVNIQ